MGSPAAENTRRIFKHHYRSVTSMLTHMAILLDQPVPLTLTGEMEDNIVMDLAKLR